MPTIDEIVRDAIAEISNPDHNEDALNEVRVKYLGKNGLITTQLKQLGKLSPEERPVVGGKINTAKQTVASLIQERLLTMKTESVKQALAKEVIDVTMPGRGQSLGTHHPVSLVKHRIEKLFSQLGFVPVSGPEIEDDRHNFEALNIPPFHPSRAMQDTFYFGDGRLLRTHMSPVQIRVMEENTPPLRMIASGRVYRHDFDVTHTPMFHQMEGLVIDKNVSFAELKGVLQEFFTLFFSQEITIRLRPSYFPFTEPSAEVDIQCVHCSGEGCRTCSQSGWLEVMGAGMVHPSVLENVNIDPEVYSGFAFGIGIDRLAMLYYGIDDLRILFENDVRFLAQFTH